MKALGTGWRGGIRWVDFEVTRLASGQPTLALHGRAQSLPRARTWLISRLASPTVAIRRWRR